MDTYSARAIDGALDAPLSPRQIRTLAIAARGAFVELQRLGFVAPGDEFDAWRHYEQMQAVSIPSLRSARQRHYRPLLAHFQEMSGRPVAGAISRCRAAIDATRQARAKLEHECRAAAASGAFDSADAAIGYASGFLRHKRGVALEQAAPRDLWHAVFLIRRRAAQLLRAPRVLAFPPAPPQEAVHA